MKSPIRILIVDDHAMVRFALSESIQRNPDMSLVGEAENGDEAVSLYRNLRPDVVIMDFKLPDRNGDEVIAAIRADFPDARVILLSIFEKSESIWRATEAGASGYVSKAAKVAEVINAIREVAVGKPYFSEGLAEKLAERRQQENLNSRELAVLEHARAQLHVHLGQLRDACRGVQAHVASTQGAAARTIRGGVAAEPAVAEAAIAFK